MPYGWRFNTRVGPRLIRHSVRDKDHTLDRTILRQHYTAWRAQVRGEADSKRARERERATYLELFEVQGRAIESLREALEAVTRRHEEIAKSLNG